MRNRWRTCTRGSTLKSTSDTALLSTALLAAANSAPRTVVFLAWTAAALPALQTAADAMEGRAGANLPEILIRDSGYWALVLLQVTLAMSPLRHALACIARRSQWRYGKRFSDWNWLIRIRRPAGLASFFYGIAHLAFYVALDIDFSMREYISDLRTKLHIDAGTLSFVLLVPLAVTSTDAWVRRLKRNWKRLHMLVYPAAIFAVLHFILLSKPGMTSPAWQGMILAVLLGYRVVARLAQGEARNERPDGTIPERPIRTPVIRLAGEAKHLG